LCASTANAQGQIDNLGTASAQVTDALNRYAAAAEPLREKMSLQQQVATTLLFAAAMAMEDNALSLSGICALQTASKAPAMTDQKLVQPLIQQFKTSSSQQVANISVAVAALPTTLARQANLLNLAVMNAAATIERGCRDK